VATFAESGDGGIARHVAASADGASATTVDPQPLVVLLVSARRRDLFQYNWFQLLRLQQLSREYHARCRWYSARPARRIGRLRSHSAVPNEPLNLVLFREDLERLCNDDVVDWAQTVNVICGKWPFKNPPESPAFATAGLSSLTKTGVRPAWLCLGGTDGAHRRARDAAGCGAVRAAADNHRHRIDGTELLRGRRHDLAPGEGYLLSRMFTKDADRVSSAMRSERCCLNLIVLGVRISVFADLLSLPRT
jgi:hypothetical protein